MDGSNKCRSTNRDRQCTYVDPFIGVDEAAMFFREYVLRLEW